MIGAKIQPASSQSKQSTIGILASHIVATSQSCTKGKPVSNISDSIKETGNYTWEFQKQPYKDLEKRADFLRKNGHWDKVLDVFLDKKNSNDDHNKHSRSLYAETINECFNRYAYMGTTR